MRPIIQVTAVMEEWGELVSVEHRFLSPIAGSSTGVLAAWAVLLLLIQMSLGATLAEEGVGERGSLEL
ncbi:hypothetical protein GGI1_24476 [Acidithiobacillus sp. GGI-221]|nr:hypothetical protein GGI1_24476 [Acidithiobacillus sp. GGI-221]